MNGLGAVLDEQDELRQRLEKPQLYLNSFRLALAAFFLMAGPVLNLGADAPTLFIVVSLFYLLVVILLGFGFTLPGLGPVAQVTTLVLVDITVLTLIMGSSGGYRSGMPILLMVTLAAGGLLGRGRMVLFFASYATIAVLFENFLRTLRSGESADFFSVGITCIGFFAIAQLARLLASWAEANEALARKRGEDLASQFRVNQQIIADMQDGVLVIDGDQSLRQFNPAACRLLGRALHKGERLELLSPALAALRQEHSQNRIDRVPRALTAEANGKALVARLIGLGKGSGAVIYLEDQDQVNRQVQQIKLAALGRLTASFAHEIRNPLSAIAQASELLVDEQRMDTQRRLISIIGNNAQRIERLVSDVLALGRRDEALPEVLPLGLFVAELLDEFTLGLAEKAQVQNRVPPDLQLVVDRTHLRQILWNLLDNARRYSSTAAGAICIQAQARDDVLTVLEVTDDGPGIPEELHAHVFEPFFTTHSKGTGLGLYIARELADANGLQLDLLPSRQGACFRLTGRSRP